MADQLRDGIERLLAAGWRVRFGVGPRAGCFRIAGEAMHGQKPGVEYVDVDENAPDPLGRGVVALEEAIAAAQAAWPPTLVVDDALVEEVDDGR